MMVRQSLIERSKDAAKFTLIFKTASQLFGGIATILIVRALTESEYGIYSLLYSMISLISLVASLGIDNTLQRYSPEYYEKKEFILAHTLYRTASFLRLISNVILLGLVLLMWEQVAPILKLTAYKPYFMLFTLIIFLDLQRRILDICLASYFLQKYAKSLGCLFPIVRCLGYGYIILAGKNLWYALITDLLAYVIVFLSLQILYFKKIPTDAGVLKRFPGAEKKRVARYAMFYNLNDAGDGLLNSYFDNFIIIMFLNPLAVGAYSFGVTVTILLGRLLPLSYFMDVIRPAFFSAGVSGGFKDATLFFQNIMKINSAFTIPCFFFLLLYMPDMIMLFLGGKFIDHAAVPCSIFLFFQVLFLPAGLIAQFKEKANIVLYSKIFALYNLAADVLFIQWFGIWGAVLATGTAVFGKNMFIWYFVREDASFKGLGSFYMKIFFFWCTVAGLMVGANTLIHSHWARFIMGLTVFAAAFLIQFRCRYFTPGEQALYRRFSDKTPKLHRVFSLLNMV